LKLLKKLKLQLLKKLLLQWKLLLKILPPLMHLPLTQLMLAQPMVALLENNRFLP
jgi:hypothetical protein